MLRQGADLAKLASGIDALYLSGQTEVPEQLLQLLATAKASAQEVGDGVEITIGGFPVTVLGHGWGRYSYCLEHRHGRIGVTSSRRLPAVRVQPRAEFLRGMGALEASSWFERFIAEAVGP